MVPDPDDKTSLLPDDPATSTVTVTDRTAPMSRAPAQDSNRLPIGTRLSEFEITGVVGEGGFGIVYAAHDHSLDRDIAIKEYMPTSLASRYDGITVTPRGGDAAETFEAGRRSFVNEARMLARFDHPSLLKVYRFWEANGTAYMAMPYYKGVTLRQRLREKGAPDESWLRAMLAPLLDALDVIHRENIFHRDIAPDNIFLLGDERPVLLDFGAARRVIGDKTHALTVILKPGFAPVEQYADVPKLRQGPWTDLYALAAVVYCAVGGEKPPPSIGRYVSDTMKPLSEIGRSRYSKEFLTAVDAALRVHPDARPQNAAEFRALLAGAAPRAEGAAATERSAGQRPSAEVPDADATVRIVQDTIPKTETLAEVTKTPPPASSPAVADRTEVMTAPRSQRVPVLEARTEARSQEAESPRSGAVGRIAAGIMALAFLAGGGYYAVRVLSRPAVTVPSAPTVQAVPPSQEARGRTQPRSSPLPALSGAGESVSSQTAHVQPSTAMNSAKEPVPAVPAAKKAPAVPGKRERLDRLLAEADASYSRKDFAKAQGLANQALKLDPDNAAALAIRDKAQKAAWSEVQIQ
jgi:serine/threonine protein kinase